MLGKGQDTPWTDYKHTGPSKDWQSLNKLVLRDNLELPLNMFLACGKINLPMRNSHMHKGRTWESNSGFLQGSL